MPNWIRKFALTAHIAFSVGWFGSAVVYLAIALDCLGKKEVQALAYGVASLEFIGWFVIVPLGLAALITGLVQSLGSEWGLFRYYWILVKFALTIGAVTILLLHMPAVGRSSGV